MAKRQTSTNNTTYCTAIDTLNTQPNTKLSDENKEVSSNKSKHIINKGREWATGYEATEVSKLG